MSVETQVNKNGLSIYWMALLCLVLGPWQEWSALVLAMDRGALLSHEYWRLWTGHLIHLSWAHLALNLGAVLVLQQMFGKELVAGRWVLAAPLIAPLTAFLWLALSNYEAVFGLSALLHGLFVYAACLALARDRPLAWLMLVIIGIKIGAEQLFGASNHTEQLIALPVATDTHLYGALCGAALGALVRMTKKKPA